MGVLAREVAAVSEFPRAYLRMLPNIDQHPDPLAMVRAMCAAARQPVRGVFREPIVIERAIGRKAYRLLVERGDIVPAKDGKGVYLEGWNELQEGDMTVAERMRRYRKRKSDAKVTKPASPHRNGVTTTAIDNSDVGTSQAEDEGSTPPPQAGRRNDGTNPRALGTNPRANGTSPRQIRRAEKQGPTSLGAVLRRANEVGRPPSERAS